MIQTLMLKAGRFRLPVQCAQSEGRLFLKFGFNKKLLAEIKTMEGHVWHGFEDGTYHDLLKALYKSIKCWSITDSPRNRFQLDCLQGKDVYARWDQPAAPIQTDRGLYKNQYELVAHGLQYHYCILAADMGLGKSLAAIEIMEHAARGAWWYVAPRSALASVELELRKWNAQVIPEMMTYEGLVKKVSQPCEAPMGIFFDESSKIKTPSAKRSKAALHVANAIRDEHGEAGYVILMSGTPSPKSPADWWHQCEVAWPGFLKEGNRPKFELRLGVFEKMESAQGSIFNKRVTWLDNPNKCQECGLLKETHQSDHTFVRSKNEIESLYRRLKGLVVVQFKSDCLDLPDKVYRTVVCEPMPSTLRAAQIIKRATPRAAQAIILLRELSDGFQYQEIEDGTADCKVCVNGIIRCPQDDIDIDCFNCGGSSKIPKYTRVANRVKCPKDDALIDLLDEHHEVGRLVVYAGFQASVDRCCEIAIKEKWQVIRWDGRGPTVIGPSGPISVDALELFNNGQGRVCFVGHPGSSGMGLTLTASPSIVYYSNDFNAEYRIQSEDRIYRIGCKGAQIIDLIHLPTDQMIIDNLKEKRRIQSLTMGQIDEAFA